MSDDDFLEAFSPDEQAAMAAHYGPDGPVQAAFSYMGAILAARSKPVRDLSAAFTEMWQGYDPELQFIRAQAWIHNNRGHADVSALVNDEGVLSLAAGSAHELWEEFARIELAQLIEIHGGVDIGTMAAASHTRIVAPGVELVLLVDNPDGEMRRFDEPTLIRTVATWLFRHDGKRWLLASHSDRLPERGWPPTFPASAIVDE